MKFLGKMLRLIEALVLNNIVLSVFMESRLNGKPHLSIGRLVLAAIFLEAIQVWHAGREVPDGMLAFLMASAGYVLGSKGMDTVKLGIDAIAGVRKPKQTVDPAAAAVPEDAPPGKE